MSSVTNSHSVFYQNTLNLPQELKEKSFALVGFSGLDIINNAIHKSIWDSFNNKPERQPIQYRIISNIHRFPIVKPRRNTYDWYIPKGILKKNWLGKYLYEIPALMVIFFDLDWTDNLWNEKVIECASKVQSLRAALEGRNTYIIVVLIQNHLPMHEDPLAAERAIGLCSSCELNAQSLYVLPHGQHLAGYISRLEKAFFEFCDTFYHTCVKNIKLHKEHLKKNSHQNLFVRHEFKMGFFNELKQDLHAAHRHYALSYKNLLDIRIVDTNALEIRTIAGYLNYKICKLQFALSLPREAISQFKSHIDKFKTRIGFQELTFEHYAWLSKQYEIFADIFDEAVKLGLPAVQTQHPGIYFQQAAQFALLRKNACKEICSSVSAYPHPDPLEGIERLEFYGQRPWRPGKVSAEPPDPATETDGIKALQYLEKQHVNHSSIIITLYGSAITQYKIYRCPRTRRHLVLQMAEECYDSKDFGKALTLLTHMLSDYREEKWYGIISNILEKAINCAFLTANVQDYMELSLEILSSSVTVSLDDKRRIYENFNRILKKQIPYGNPKLSHECLQNAIILWQPVFQSDNLNFPLDVSHISVCIEVKASFIQSKFQIDQPIALEIFTRSSCPFPLTFQQISVKINKPSKNIELYVPEFTDNNSLTFHCNEVKKFLVEFEANSQDLNHEIGVESVSILIGNPSECSAVLNFSTEIITQTDLSESQHFKKNVNDLNFENIKLISKALIVPRDSKLNVKFEHSPPVLVGECYQINVVILNNENFPIKDLKVEISSSSNENPESNGEFALVPTMNLLGQLPMFLDIPNNLEKNSKLSTSIYFRASKPEIRNIFVKIIYSLDNEKSVISIKNEAIILPVVQPFEVETRFLTNQMQNTQKFYAGESFGVMPVIKFLSPWTIFIEKTSIELTYPIKSIDEKFQSHLAGHQFNKDEKGNEIFFALSEKQSDQNLEIGEYTITWKRLENGTVTRTSVTLNGHYCDWIPLNLKMLAPAYGIVRTPTIIQYHLINQSSHLIQLEVTVEASEGFMFAGFRQVSISVLPFSRKILKYNLYPLLSGCITLPKLILSIPENSTEGPALRQDQLNQLIERAIPHDIFVIPQKKGQLSSSDNIAVISA